MKIAFGNAFPQYQRQAQQRITAFEREYGQMGGSHSTQYLFQITANLLHHIGEVTKAQNQALNALSQTVQEQQKQLDAFSRQGPTL